MAFALIHEQRSVRAQVRAAMYGAAAAIGAYYVMMYVGDFLGLPPIATMGLQVLNAGKCAADISFNCLSSPYSCFKS